MGTQSINDTKTIIVTGAGSGIGRAIASRFAADGYAIICADINGSSAEKTAEMIGRNGSAKALRCDITQEASVAEMVSETISWTGRIDCVAANAGAMVEGGILSLSLDDWHRAINTNATGAFLTARAVLPHLQRQKGSLVFTCSTVALAGMKGVAAYSAAKGAIAALTRQLAADFAADSVRINAVAPGAVRTPLSESQFRSRAKGEAEFEELLSEVIQRYPLQRWGTPEEVADMVHMLGTDRSSWVTGQILPVDGGLLELR